MCFEKTDTRLHILKLCRERLIIDGTVFRAHDGEPAPREIHEFRHPDPAVNDAEASAAEPQNHWAPAPLPVLRKNHVHLQIDIRSTQFRK